MVTRRRHNKFVTVNDIERGIGLPGQGSFKHNTVVVTVLDEELPVACWCDTSVVPVLKSELRVGLTRACHRSPCQLIDRSARGVHTAMLHRLADTGAL